MQGGGLGGSMIDEETCACLPGYVDDYEGTACVPPEDACQPHATYSERDGDCRCEEGYVESEDGTSCIDGDDLCPAHGHFVQDGDQMLCECDEGYVTSYDRDACVLPEDVCPEGRPSLVINGEVLLCCPNDATSVAISNGRYYCNCEEGNVWDADSNQCVPE